MSEVPLYTVTIGCGRRRILTWDESTTKGEEGAEGEGGEGGAVHLGEDGEDAARGEERSLHQSTCVSTCEGAGAAREEADVMRAAGDGGLPDSHRLGAQHKFRDLSPPKLHTLRVVHLGRSTCHAISGQGS